MSTTTIEKPSENTAVTPVAKGNPTQQVAKSIRDLLAKGTLHLPDDYSAENALKSAWLKLQTVQNTGGQPALTVCTHDSVVNALLAMIYQGLNVDKNQGYFIVYGQALTWQRSYFGDQALAQRVRPGIEFYSAVVYNGDEFEYETIRGRKVITKHKQKLENQDNSKIIAAYCGTVVFATGEDLGVTLMTMDEIKKSWMKSKTYKGGSSGPHGEQPDQMALRTVIRRHCKPIINTSSDKALLDVIRKQDAFEMEGQMEEEMALNANGETLSIPASFTETVQPATVAAPEPVEVEAGF